MGMGEDRRLQTHGGVGVPTEGWAEPWQGCSGSTGGIQEPVLVSVG